MEPPDPATSRAAVDYAAWAATCDTVHGHVQLLGTLSAALAPPRRDLAHAALRLTVRGWETAALPSPDGTGAVGVALDLRRHEIAVEHSDGRARRLSLTPDRSVGAVTRDVLGALCDLIGPVALDLRPRVEPAELGWTKPLDRDDDHATYDPAQAGAYFAAATRAAQALRALAAENEGSSSPVRAWWSWFDLAVTIGAGAGRPQVTVGWWPGDPRYPRAAYYAYCEPPHPAFAAAAIRPDPARWDAALEEYVLDWSAAEDAPSPHAAALDFGRAALAHAQGLS